MSELLTILLYIFIGYKVYEKYQEHKELKEIRRDIQVLNTGLKNKEVDYSKFEQTQPEYDPNNYIDTAKSPFLIANSLLTKAEMNFYNVLKDIIDDEKQIICPKVRIIDVLWTKTYRVENKLTFINKVNRKHFDFVICDKETLKPLMAIELDDKSHEEESRKERDEFIDALFKDLNFKVVHIPVKYSYNPSELKEKIVI